jgi:hypothetical protein
VLMPTRRCNQSIAARWVARSLSRGIPFPSRQGGKNAGDFGEKKVELQAGTGRLG